MTEPIRDVEREQRIAEIVRDSMRHELRSQFQLAKNGETWRTYFLRQFTLERIGIAVLLVFQFGGGYQEARHSLNLAAEQASTASVKADAASRKADDAIATLQATRDELRKVTDELKLRSEEVSDLRDRVALSITRGEFNGAMQQQIVPRLERIERLMDEERKR